MLPELGIFLSLGLRGGRHCSEFFFNVLSFLNENLAGTV